ncbi:MAG: ATP-binding protein, partial [Clostridiales bacterium]|nr:ATP-binding protein [Clostridiales bacterium]
MARMKQFKTESKRILNLMINSIYTHKEIFLRELISNASDAMDKLYFQALTEGGTDINRSDFEIFLETNKDIRTLTIRDNGIGMTGDELENNLGVIAKSGTMDFRQRNEENLQKMRPKGAGDPEADEDDDIGDGYDDGDGDGVSSERNGETVIDADVTEAEEASPGEASTDEASDDEASVHGSGEDKPDNGEAESDASAAGLDSDSDEAGADEAGADETGADETGADETGADEAD